MEVNKQSRFFAALLAAVLCFLLPFSTPASVLPFGEDDLVFFFEGREYFLNTPAKPLLDAMSGQGLPMEVIAADSCLFPGKDKEYTTSELLVGTLPKGKGESDVIETIMVLSGDHLTKRGIGIGDGGEAVLAAYGEPTLIDYDLLIYSLEDAPDSPQLVFVMDLSLDSVLTYYYFFNTQE